LANVSQATNQGNLSAIGMAPGLLGADQSIINQALQANALQRGVQQAGIDGQMAQVNEQNVLDQNQLNALLSAAGMGQGMFGTNTTQTGGGPSALGTAAGGALTGAGIGGLIPGATLGSNLGLPGAILGGGLGLLGLI